MRQGRHEQEHSMSVGISPATFFVAALADRTLNTRLPPDRRPSHLFHIDYE